ncbi:MAG: protein kinase [Acidobacteriota bacterium]
MTAHDPIGIGPYQTTGVLGQGGMGIVYGARHRETGERVALKTVRVPDEGMLGNIRREILALSKIRHPGIVRIVEHGLAGGMPWYAMELIEGANLKEHLRGNAPSRTTERQDIGETVPDALLSRASVPPATRRPLEPGDLGEALCLVRRICGPLAFLHGEGIVHRDIKPENIVVRRGVRPILVDFGLAARFGQGASREVVEISGGVTGTVAYMAPEQGRGDLVDARADLYALGCVFYEMLTGAPPFVGTTAAEVLWRHERDEPRPPSELVGGILPDLDALVLRLLAKEARDRLGHADDLARIVSRVAIESAIPAPPGTSWLEPDEGPAPRPFLFRPGLLGREDPMKRLRRRVAGLGGGSGRLVLVGGESGVGKTRILTEVAAEAKRSGFSVLVGECLPPGEGRPLQALLHPLDAVADRARERGPRYSELVFGPRGAILAQYAPAIAALVPPEHGTPPESLPPEAAQTRLSLALIETFLAMARDEPVVLCVDDLQWADELALGFLDLALRGRHLESAPLLCVGAYRAEEATARLEQLLSEPGAEHLALSRLDEEAVAHMLREMLATDPPGLLATILSRQSAGNPFFVAEYVRLAIQSALLTRDESGRWCVMAGSDLDPGAFESLPPPPTIRELVTRRIAGLEPGDAELLRSAAVLGRELDVGVLAAVAGLRDDALMESLLALEKRQILEPVEGGTLRFVHDKLRRRPTAARRVVEAPLVNRRGARGQARRCSVLAHHREEAGEIAAARSATSRPPRSHTKGTRSPGGGRLCRKSLALFDAPNPESLSGPGSSSCSTCARAAGRAAEAEVGRAKASWRPPRSESGAARRGHVRARACIGRPDRTRSRSRRRIAPSRSSRPRERPADRHRARHARQDPRGPRPRRRGPGPLRGARRRVAQPRRPEATRDDAPEPRGPPSFAGGRRPVGAILEAALVAETGTLLDTALIDSNIGVLEAEEGNFEVARRYFEEGCLLYRKVGNKRHEAIRNLDNLASLELDLGNLPRARELLLEALALARATANPHSEALIGVGLEASSGTWAISCPPSR